MLADGFFVALEALGRGIEPDPELWIDEWSEQYMILPRGIAAEHGKYSVERTPQARDIMRCLSPGHPCKRVVVVGASQLLKTQVGINWISASIDQAPSNFLVLLPTTGLAKRVSARLDKTFNAVERLRKRIAKQRSRDSRNTVDTKEFDGGTLYITTAGSAANLAEIPARYIYGDEIDRWQGDVDGEGAPDKIAEARTSTFTTNKKIYYSSSPTWVGRSRIWKWFERGTQNICLLPCPHCGEHHQLLWENMHWDDGLTKAWMACPHCGGIIEEGDKAVMLQLYRWQAQAAGDGETESFHVSALYAPLGWTSWLMLAKEFVEAESAEADGDVEAMQAFRNTRLALCFAIGKDVATPEELIARADQETYAELIVPWGGLLLTAGVDVQHDRLAVVVRAWGRGEESWLVYWGEFHGQTMVPMQGAWLDLEAFLFRDFEHASGAHLRIRRISLDTSDGTATQDAAYAFCRRYRSKGVMAVKGASERSDERREIFSPPKPAVDSDKKQKSWKYGLRPYIVGTSRAKDLILEARVPLIGSGPGRVHWYKTVRPDYWEQLTSEVKVPSKTRRGRKSWEKKSGTHNEALDCEVYALHAARSLKTNLFKESNWLNLEQLIRQRELLAETPVEFSASAQSVEAGTEAAEESASVPAEAVQPSALKQETPSALSRAKKRPVPTAERPRSRGGYSITRW